MSGETYDDLSELTRRVTEAAIKAAVLEYALTGSCAQGYFTGSVNSWPTDDNYVPVNVMVTYPAAEWFVIPIPEDPSTKWAWDDNAKTRYIPRPFTQAFYLSVQRDVGLIFQDWWFLPDPASFEPAVDALRSVSHDLNAQGAFIAPSTDPHQGPASTTISGRSLEINDYVGFIERNIGQFRGAMIDMLDSAYVSRLRPTLAGQQVAAAVMGTLVAGEQQMWDRARQDVVTICLQAEAAFNAVGEAGGDFDWSDVLKIAGVVAAGLSIFVTGGAGAVAIGDTRAIIGIVTAFLPAKTGEEEPKAAISGRTYTDVCNSVAGALSKLSAGMADAEKAFQQCGTKAVGYFHQNPGYIDLAEPTDFLTNDKGQYLGPGETIDIVGGELIQVAAHFDLVGTTQATQLGRVESADQGDSSWIRSSGVGLGTDGHYGAYHQVYELLSSALRSSASENHSVASRLVQVTHDFRATDGQVRADLKPVEAEISSTEAPTPVGSPH